MPKSFEIKINSILGGISPNIFQGRADQFHASLGIDPDLAIADGAGSIKTSGVLRPAAYSDFSGAGLSGNPMWMMVPASASSLYVYASDGDLLEYNSVPTAASEISRAPINADGNGSGAAFYNNYIYVGTSSSVTRIGPMDAAGPIFNSDWWSNEVAGPALGNPAYPSNRSVTLPNKPMHVHNDGMLYFATYDVASAVTSTRGRGLVHRISTFYDGAVEGGVNDGNTQYNVLDLPFGHMPTDIESWGTDLVISTIPAGSDTAFAHGKAKLFFWDTLSLNYYRVVELPDPICSALLNSNGNLYIFSGNMIGGVRVSVYAGGYSVKPLTIFEEGMPPPAGAVDALGNRVVWGAYNTYPENAATVYSLGYKDANLPLSLHNIIYTSGSLGGALPMVSALKYVQQASFARPRVVVGWKNDAPDYGLDALSASYGVAVWRSLQYQVGDSFRITEITIPLGVAVGASMTLIPSIYINDGDTVIALPTISTVLFTSSERRIVFNNLGIEGINNFFLELRWSGTALLPVVLPIIIRGETIENATR